MTSLLSLRSRSTWLFDRPLSTISFKHRPLSTASYKHTLRLPNANLPHGDYSDGTHWQELFEWQQQRNDLPKFILHDGPPFANGDLHMGHWLNKTIKDIVVRYKIMKGYNVDYRPGWDCHGLPIESKVKNTESDPLAIRKACHDLAAGVMLEHQNQMRSWSFMADYHNAYCTMSKEYEAKQIEVFGEMAFRGLLRRERRPVHWSPSSKTALAEAELEYRDDHCSTAVYVAFPISTSSGTLVEKLVNTSALIWTTTPWTLEANSAIAFNAKSVYAVIKTSKGQFLVGKARFPALREIFPDLSVVVDGIKGSDLGHIRCRHPYQSHRLSIPLVASEYVSDNAGTCLVHTSGGHGKEDFLVCRQHNLPILCPVDEEGRFTAEANELAGKPVLSTGQDAILQMMAEQGTLIHEENYIHSYPYDWRTKKPIIQRAASQWFCRLDGPVREAALEALSHVSMFPDGGQRLRAMLTARDDWCISRQRVWGLPIPVFYHKQTGETLLEIDTVAHVRDMVACYGADCWWELPIDNLLPESRRDQAHLYERGLDTLDVWFDSGSAWAAVLDGVQADLVVEGSDQHRGWFQSLLLTKMAAGGKTAPYRSVVTHGFVMDEESRKMSKSLGNVVGPKELVKDSRYSVETLRMWVASSDFSGDVHIGPVNLAKANDSLRRIRNTARFMLGCIEDMSASDYVDYDRLRPIDRYALHVLATTSQEINESFESHQFAKVLATLNKFLGGFFSPIYANACKDRLYADAKWSIGRRSSQTVLSIILSTLTRFIAPIAPHSAEDIFLQMKQDTFLNMISEKSIFRNGWVQVQAEWINDSLSTDWTMLLRLREIINKMLERVRDNKHIGNPLQASVTVEVPADSPLAIRFTEIGEGNIAELLSVSQFHLAPLFPEAKYFLKHTLSGGEIDSTADEWIHVGISPAEGSKCTRCWRHTVMLASSSLCVRCENVVGTENNATFDSLKSVSPNL